MTLREMLTQQDGVDAGFMDAENGETGIWLALTEPLLDTLIVPAPVCGECGGSGDGDEMESWPGVLKPCVPCKGTGRSGAPLIVTTPRKRLLQLMTGAALNAKDAGACPWDTHQAVLDAILPDLGLREAEEIRHGIITANMAGEDGYTVAVLKEKTSCDNS